MAKEIVNIQFLLDRIDRNLLIVIGVVIGVVVTAAVLRKMWWLLTLVLLMPTALYMTYKILPKTPNPTYEYFFFGVVGLSVAGLSYFLYHRY